MKRISTDLKEIPKSPETINVEKKEDQVPHDESASEKSTSEKSASEKSTSATDTPCHTIELDRNVTIKLGKFLTVLVFSNEFMPPFGATIKMIHKHFTFFQLTSSHRTNIIGIN